MVNMQLDSMFQSNYFFDYAFLKRADSHLFKTQQNDVKP